MVSNNKPMIMAAIDGAKPQRKRQWGWVKPLVWQARPAAPRGWACAEAS